MLKNMMAALVFLSSLSAWANSPRVLDGAQITNGAATLTLPSSTDTLVGRATTDTLTNKTLTSPVITGATSLSDALAFVNASDATKELFFSLSGMTTGKTLTISFGQTNTETVTFPNVGSGDTVATLLATQTFGANSTWHGNAVGATYGGTGVSNPTAHGVLVGEGASAVASVTGSTAGYVLTWNSSGDPSFQVLPVVAPSLNGGSGSAESVTAAGGVTLTSVAYFNFAWLAGSGGAVVVTKTPSVAAGTADGQILKLIGTSATNTVTLQDQANLSGSGLSLNGNWVAGKDSTMTLHWDNTQSLWVEDSRR